MSYQATDYRNFPASRRAGQPLGEFRKPTFTNLAQALKDRWTEHRRRRTDRQAFEHLLTLDEEMLNDIGVTRANVEWASQLPLSANASHELERIARSDRTQSKRRARPKIRP